MGYDSRYVYQGMVNNFRFMGNAYVVNFTPGSVRFTSTKRMFFVLSSYTLPVSSVCVCVRVDGGGGGIDQKR